MQTKRLCQPPAKRCRQRRFGCQDEKVLPLEGEKPRRRVLMKAQLDGKLPLRPRLCSSSDPWLERAATETKDYLIGRQSIRGRFNFSRRSIFPARGYLLAAGKVSLRRPSAFSMLQ
jgi:hypothetical protein